MSPNTPSSPRSPDPESLLSSSPLSVSIAGEQDYMTAALDDAVAKLSEATSSTDPSDPTQPDDGQSERALKKPTRVGPPQDSTPLFELLEAVAAAPSRREAVAKIVDLLAQQCGDSNVRCAMGKSRLSFMYDSRLGWLGPESSLHQNAVDQWESPWQRSDDPNKDVASCVRRGKTIELCCPETFGSGRCVVWISGDRIDTRVFRWLQPAAHIIGSVLWSRPTRSWPAIVVRTVKRSSMLMVAVTLALMLLAVWPVHYRVASTVKVETTQQRIVSTPFEATLLYANVRPGDTVSAGDVLVELDGRPLRLEREAIEAEIQQVTKEHDVALATRRIADAQKAALKRQQLSRQRELLSQRLGQLKVTSPIDGVVVSGDLDRFVGSPLERGQTLIEVAPLENLILEVEIPEHEIGYVGQGADTRIKIDAVGGQSIRLPLQEVYPSAELRDDQNVFVGRIEIDNPDQELRPGMRGEAITYGPLRPWVWSWVRGGFERILWWIGY